MLAAVIVVPLSSLWRLTVSFGLFPQSCRWFCDCVPRANKSRGALCPEEDVCQQWAWSAGVQTRDSNNGELPVTERVSVCSHFELVGLWMLGKQHTWRQQTQLTAFWNCTCKCPKNPQWKISCSGMNNCWIQYTVSLQRCCWDGSVFIHLLLGELCFCLHSIVLHVLLSPPEISFRDWSC